MTWWLGLVFSASIFYSTRLVTQKGSNLSIKHCVQQLWHICSFIVIKLILVNGCDTITLKAFCQSSSHLTFLSSPSFVRSSASVALTLIQMPSAHCFHWKLVRFHAYSSEHNKYVSVSLCSSGSRPPHSAGKRCQTRRIFQGNVMNKKAKRTEVKCLLNLTNGP